MKVLLVLVPISIALLGVAIWAFAWAVRKGQFDDLDTPALDILADDPLPKAAAAAERDGAGNGHVDTRPPASDAAVNAAPSPESDASADPSRSIRDAD